MLDIRTPLNVINLMEALIISHNLPQLLVAIATFIISWSVIRWRRQMHTSPSRVRRPPCLPTVPILGSLPFIEVSMNKLHDHFMQHTVTYGNVFALYIGPRYTVILNGFDSIREALFKKSTHFAEREPFFTEITNLNVNRKGLLSARYELTYRRKRQLYIAILKQLGFGQRRMEHRINVEVAELVHQLRLTGGQPFDPSEILHSCILNVINSIVFGQRRPYGHPELVQLRNCLQAMYDNIAAEVELFPILRFFPFYRSRYNKSVTRARNLLNTLLQKIDACLPNIDAEPDEHSDSFVRWFVRLTMTSGSTTPLSQAEFDREELVLTLRDLFVGGDDTTSTNLRWILVHLANEPAILKRMQDEVDTVVGTDRLPSLDDEIKMPYTQAVILETFRRHTLLPLAMFHSTTCDTEVGGYFIPANTTVIINLHSVHMDSTKWKEPTDFKPERFLNGRREVIDKERIVSFSMGKRSCIGEPLARQEIFLFLTGIVQSFDVHPPEGHQKIVCEDKFQATLGPTEYKVRLIPRRA